MATSDRSPSEQVPLRTSQIVVSALIGGVVIFAAVAIALTWQKPPGEPFMAYFSAVFAVPVVIFGFVFAKVMLPTIRKSLPPEIAADKIRALYAEYQGAVLLRNASLEGAAFLNVIAYLTTALWWSLAVVAVLVAVMIVGFPTSSRFDDWVRRRSEDAQFESQ